MSRDPSSMHPTVQAIETDNREMLAWYLAHEGKSALASELPERISGIAKAISNPGLFFWMLEMEPQLLREPFYAQGWGSGESIGIDEYVAMKASSDVVDQFRPTMKTSTATRIVAGRMLENDFSLLLEDMKSNGADTDGMLQAIVDDDPIALASRVNASLDMKAILDRPSESAVGPFLAMWAAGWDAVDSLQWLEKQGVDSDGNEPAVRPGLGRIAWDYRPIEEAVAHGAVKVIDHLVDRYGTDILLRLNKAQQPPLFRALRLEAVASAIRILEIRPDAAGQEVGEWILKRKAEQFLIQEGKPHMADWLQTWKAARAAKHAILEIDNTDASPARSGP
ncbi:hypothetical protein DAPPUDRAFT_124138 [Daphnia pulex]|uniref:Uncharacterized protein n=1 Tax=Daphnia pulex TaxID=6669 RepID=E9I6D0_DAPPU|nr:hypothetical protein DAPPUDRAFT_124138 [Daphnia pulex]|eukprot:EFX60450.1 hypothetical protein DAPPUDRAFT_124138 [Daphnia pulex]